MLPVPGTAASLPLATPSLAAGAPFTDDVTKCRIVLLDRDAYGRQLTDAQWDRLRATSPTVCATTAWRASAPGRPSPGCPTNSAPAEPRWAPLRVRISRRRELVPPRSGSARRP
ncbi:DUF6351 family protein [Streptomyces canus]|uniref:DUF6351 family protein n=1 Tax=Streptomyces canus TaxID=58343 RepID=UPI00381AAC2C